VGEHSKAIVALIMAVLVVLEALTGFSVPGLSEEVITVVLAALTPILVWLIPNRPV
jgi:purine-cytosine permease-like protein